MAINRQKYLNNTKKSNIVVCAVDGFKLNRIVKSGRLMGIIIYWVWSIVLIIIPDQAS